MSFDLFQKVVDEIKPYARYISLHNFGEPLLNPALPLFIAYAAAAGLKTWLSTNATLLTEAKSLELLDSRLDVIIFSLDGATKATYEKVRRQGQFEETKTNVERFLELKKKRNARRPLTIVQIISMLNTENEIAAFQKEWQPKADQVLVKAFATWSDQVGGIKDLAKYGQRPQPHAGKRPPCLYLWRSLVVQWDGTIVLCCNDFDNKIVVGDANRQSLRDVWNSPLMRDLRARHLRGDFETPICRDCGEWIGEPLRRLFPWALTSLRKIRGFLRGGFRSDLGPTI